ncbi:MAG: short-subunit dehydrogenase [Rickettsiales bacterium]|jgi:short-subunit dehydrogenase
MSKNHYYNNKNILIIGGSFGIGEELCREFSNLGANLAISARSKDKIEDLCKKLPGNHLPIACDVSIKKDLEKLSAILDKEWGKIDLIIFCVGAYKPMNLDNFELSKSQEIIDINLNSFFNFLNSFLPYFKQEKISHLAIISSVAGYFGMPNSLAYGASKAALSNLSESLFYELKKYQTKVQLINPGFVKTRLTDQNNFKMPGIIEPGKAAKIIIKNLSKNKFEIKFPFFFASTMRILSILPYKFRFFLFKNYDK